MSKQTTCRILTLQEIVDHDLQYVLYDSVLESRIPKFLYFDEYYQMKGEDSVEALRSRLDREALEDSDYPLLGLLKLARSGTSCRS